MILVGYLLFKVKVIEFSFIISSFIAYLQEFNTSFYFIMFTIKCLSYNIGYLTLKQKKKNHTVLFYINDDISMSWEENNDEQM